MSTAIAWFEIPTREIERAQRFYEALLGVSLKRENLGPHTLAVFPYAEPGAGGCLIAGRDVAAPSREGTLVGRYAHVVDPDGNRVGLHAPR